MVAIFATSAFLPLNGRAQQIQNDRPYIEVNGIAEKEVIPDMIYINIVIEERFSGGKVTIEDQEKQLKEALQSLGIDSNEKYRIKALVLWNHKPATSYLLVNEINRLYKFF